MAALIRSQKVTKCLRCNLLLRKRAVSKSSQLVAAWNKDYMPSAEVVETPSQLEEVAKKYNIPPELYRTPVNPYGDYPELGEFSQEQRDPSYHWDDYTHKRDFGEFMDLKYSIYSEDRCDPLYARRNKYSLATMVLAIIVFFVGGSYFIMWTLQYPAKHCYYNKQLPYNTKNLEYVTFNTMKTSGNFDRNVHYTFEPAE